MNISIRTKIYTAISCFMSTLAMGSALSTSAAAEDVVTKTVHFNDLNINSPEGAKVLYQRIRAAARNVCVPEFESDPILRMGNKACIDKAIDAAVRKVNAPALTALRFGSTPDDLMLARK